MARTRTQIKTLVGYNTGRGTEKEALIDLLCDEALDIALDKHPFRDAQSRPDAIAITEDATSVSIAAITGLLHIVTARIVEDSGSQYAILRMKDQTWWDRHVIDAAEQLKGWPKHGFRFGTSIYFERPCEDDLTLALSVTTRQAFSSDATECPIAVLETFVVHYATAFVFASIQDWESAERWKKIALGSQWDEGIVGGSLLQAINSDRYDLSEEMSAQASGDGLSDSGVAVRNLITDHDDYGKTRSWF